MNKIVSAPFRLVDNSCSGSMDDMRVVFASSKFQAQTQKPKVRQETGWKSCGDTTKLTGMNRRRYVENHLSLKCVGDKMETVLSRLIRRGS